MKVLAREKLKTYAGILGSQEFKFDIQKPRLPTFLYPSSRTKMTGSLKPLDTALDRVCSIASNTRGQVFRPFPTGTLLWHDR